MKKLLMVFVVGLLALGLVGCTKTDETGKEDVPDVEQTVVLSEVMDGILANYEMPTLVPVEEHGLQELATDVYWVTPMMNVQATEILIARAAPDASEALMAVIDEHFQQVEQNWATYLPDQYEMVQNRVVFVEKDVIAVIVSEHAAQIAEDLKAAL